MILSRKRVSEILTILGTASGNKIVDVANYVCFRYDRNAHKLLISSTDFNAFITIEYGDLGLDEVDIGEIFLIDFKKLSSIVKASTTEDIEFIDNKNTITIVTNGNYVFQKLEDVSSFPIFDFNFDEIARWNVSEISNAWDKVVIAVSQDVTKLAYQGVNYDGSFAATDNRRLSVVFGDESTKTPPMLLPTIFGNILKHCKNEVVIGPSKSGNFLVIVCEDVNMIATVRLLDANFNDYRRILGMKEEGKSIVVPKNDVLGAANRLMIFSDAMFKVLKVSVIVADGVAYLDLDLRNKGGGSESIPIIDSNVENIADEPGTVLSFNYKIDNFIDGVNSVDDQENVEIEFQDNGFMWICEEKFTYLLTPMVE